MDRRIDERFRKPRRTKGTPFFQQRNYYALAGLAFGGISWLLLELWPVTQNVKRKAIEQLKESDEFKLKVEQIRLGFQNAPVSELLAKARERATLKDDEPKPQSKFWKIILSGPEIQSKVESISKYLQNESSNQETLLSISKTQKSSETFKESETPISKHLESPYKNFISQTKTLNLNDSIIDEADFRPPKPLKKQNKFKWKLSKPSGRQAKKHDKETMRNPILKIIEDNLEHTDENPDHIQMAIALSKSTYEAECASNSQSLIKEEETPNISEILNNPEFVGSTLERFGFKSDKPKLPVELRKLPLEGSRKQKNRFKYITPILYIRTPEERESLIFSKISSILSKNISVAKTSQKQIINSSQLSQFISNTKSIFNTDIIYDSARFYVDQLELSNNSNGCGHLLKQWDFIPGRELTPTKYINIECDVNVNYNFSPIQEARCSINVQDDEQTNDSILYSFANKNKDLVNNIEIEADIKKSPDKHCINTMTANSCFHVLNEVQKLTLGSFSSEAKDSGIGLSFQSMVKTSASSFNSSWRGMSPDLFGSDDELNGQDLDISDSTQNSIPDFVPDSPSNISYSNSTQNSIPDSVPDSPSSTSNSNSLIKDGNLCQLDDKNSNLIIENSQNKFTIGKGRKKSVTQARINSPGDVIDLTDYDKNNDHLESIAQLPSQLSLDISDNEVEYPSFKTMTNSPELYYHDLNYLKEKYSNKWEDSPVTSGATKKDHQPQDNVNLLTKSDRLNCVEKNINPVLECCETDTYLGNTPKRKSKERRSHSFGNTDSKFYNSADLNVCKYVNNTSNQDNFSFNKKNYHQCDHDSSEILPLNAKIIAKDADQKDIFLTNDEMVSSQQSSQSSDVIDEELNYSSMFGTPSKNDVKDSKAYYNMDEFEDNIPERKICIQQDSTEKQSKKDLPNKVVSLEFKKHVTPDNITIKSDNVTPLPDYDKMNTPLINRELQKVGVKPLKRARGTKLLKYIYETTHPLVGSIKDYSNQESEDEDKRLIKRRKRDKKGMDRSDEFESQLSCVAKIEIVGDKIIENEKREDFIFERKQSVKIPSCQVPLQIVWHNFVSGNLEIRESILLYEPLQLESLHVMLKEQGFKFHIQDILTFLDRKSITIRTAQKQGKRHR